MKDFTIRLLSTDDSLAFFKLIKRNKNRLEDFFAGTVKYTNSLEDTIEYCKVIEGRILRKEYYPYLILDEKGSAIGFIDFKNIDWSLPKAELGTFIDLNYQGKGIITKSFEHLLDSIIKKHKFKKLFCRISPMNKRSIQLAERCGFELEGVLKKDYKTTSGELIDLCYYGRVLDEF